MNYPHLDTMLSIIAKSISEGYFTHAKTIDESSFICIVEDTVYGKQYRQLAFQDIPVGNAEFFLGLKVGDKIGHIKIMAIFDMWPLDLPVGEVRTAS
jgi:hypothetical protein